nr:unnamed protein product [Naegleria fowleri]
MGQSNWWIATTTNTTTSQQVLYSSGSSSSGVQWTPKPLNKCSAQDLIALMEHYKFSERINYDMDDKIKTHDLGGYEFTDLASHVALNDENRMRQEKERLIEHLSTKLQIPKHVANAFISEVVLEKIKNDMKQSQELVNTKTTSESTFEKYRATVMPRSMDSDSGEVSSSNNNMKVVDCSTFNVEDVFTDSSLSDWEKKGIILFKNKLKEFEKLLLSRNNTLQAQGYTGNYDADAQNSVCEDRFMYKTFGKPILANKKRRDMSSAPFIAIKLVISELGGNYLEKFARQIIANAVETEFGILHTGILVGEWKFDWYDNSIVAVRMDKNISSSNSISVIDLGYLTHLDQIKNAFESVAKVCCIYNATKTYSQRNCNCQHFVKDVLDAIGVTKPSGGSFDKYFEDLKKGTTKRKYYYSNTLQSMMESNPKAEQYKEFYERTEIEFKDRVTIDLFCHWIDSLKYFSTEEGKIDFRLLKAFDRSFCISGISQGLSVVDYSTSSGMKNQSFFGVRGDPEENSIKRIEYNVRDLYIPVPNPNNRKARTITNL